MAQYHRGEMQFVYGFAIELEIAFTPGTVEGRNVFMPVHVYLLRFHTFSCSWRCLLGAFVNANEQFIFGETAGVK